MPEEVIESGKDKKKPEDKHVLGSMVNHATDEGKAGKDDGQKQGDKSDAKAKDKKRAGKQEEKVVHTVTFDLLEEDFAAKGKEAAELQGQLDKLDREFSVVKENHKASVTLLEQDCSQVLSCIRRGKEERDVDCLKVIDFDLGVVEYWFGGRVVERRGIKPEERQTKLF